MSNPAYGAYGAQDYGGGYWVARTDGVLGRRLFAYLVDLIVVAILTVLFGFLIGVAGVLTFGLGWALYAVLVPGTFLIYNGLTVGGAAQGTIGMRMAGLRAIDAVSGGSVGFLMAVAHALLFYLGAGTFLLLVCDIVIGMARSDRRLGHDLLTGVLLIRRG